MAERRSLTGAAYNQELFGFVPQDHVLRLLGSPAYLLRLYDGLPRVREFPLLLTEPRPLEATGAS